MAKILITTIQVNLVPNHSETWRKQLKFLGRHLGFHIFFHMTTKFMPEDEVDITTELDEITNTTQPTLPNDISSSAVLSLHIFINISQLHR